VSLELSRQDGLSASGRYKAIAVVSSFSPTDYLIGIIKDAELTHHNVLVTLPGKGKIAILAEHGEYHTDVPDSDMEEFCQASATLFQTSRLASKDVASLRDSSTAKHIKNLLWLAGFHASQGRLVESRSSSDTVHEYDVIQFTQWPNLSRLPTTPNTMRIFALLMRHPSAIMLIHRKLRIQPQEVYQVYSAACAAGFVSVVSNHMGQAENDASEQAQSVQARSLLGSLFAKIAGL
jgi:hypothetical protein